MTNIWKKILEENCIKIHDNILDFSHKDRIVLKRALIRSAAYKDQRFPVELKEIGFQNGLDTFGDKILDFAIYDHFMDNFLDYQNSEKIELGEIINNHREWYSKNEILQEFSLKCITLQDYVVWGTDEFDKKIWNQSTTDILADCFEALIGAIYKDCGMKGVKKLLKNIEYFEKIDNLRSEKGQNKVDFHIFDE
jgi:dsRNA-specific ribonuclease